jgi:molybdopterin-guanine dinucleotide biosynthesis protein A
MFEVPQIDLTGVVLAGGRSLRMGRDKAELVWGDGRTFLERAITVLEQAGCSQVIVSGDRAGYDHVPDRWPNRGPLGGLVSVLSARQELADQWLIMIPVDMPWLNTTTLSRLVTAARQNNSGAVFDRGPLPMVLAPGPDRLNEARSLLASKDRHSLRNLADRLNLPGIPADQADRLDNINRPEEYRELRD